MYDVSFDYDAIDKSHILNIHKYLMVKNNINFGGGQFKKLVSASNHTKYVPLNNQKCMTQPTLINLHTNE